MASSDFELLGVEPGADADAVKAAYRAALLANHPDKVPAGVSGAEAAARTAAIQAAYEAIKRGEVTAAATPAREAVVIEEVDAGELEPLLVAAGAGLGHPCRCGDTFTTTAAAVAALPVGSFLLLPCGSCSFHLRVRKGAGSG